jgi:hypothetical protein
VARCRLCPRGSCVASGDSCHMVLRGVIEVRKAALHSTAGATRDVGRAVRPDDHWG